jgi:hypothetical protein
MRRVPRLSVAATGGLRLAQDKLFELTLEYIVTTQAPSAAVPLPLHRGISECESRLPVASGRHQYFKNDRQDSRKERDRRDQ